nr:mechanosensitive ion channel family protein [Clostridia bacterium]
MNGIMENFQEIMAVVVDFCMTSGLRIIGAILVLIIGSKLVRVIMKRVQKGKGYEKMEPTFRSFMDSLLSIALYVVLFVIIASLVGIPMASMVAAIGAAGLAVGLALQGSLSNIASGFIICVFKPFVVGDFINVAGFSGTVESINIFYTVLKTPDNQRITLPNSTVSGSAITDVSAFDTRRVDFKFSVSYSTDLDKARSIMLDAAKNNSLVLKDPAPVALVAEHSDSAIVFYLRVWTETANYWDVNFSIIETVKKEFDKNGIEIPFNQLDVHVKNS